MAKLKRIQNASDAATACPQNSRNFRHGASIFKGNKLIISTHNDIYRTVCGGNVYCSMHAEFSALHKLIVMSTMHAERVHTIRRKMKKLKIYTARDDLNANGKPCSDCIKHLLSVGLTKIYYAIDGYIEKLNVQSTRSSKANVKNKQIVRFVPLLKK